MSEQQKFFFISTIFYDIYFQTFRLLFLDNGNHFPDTEFYFQLAFLFRPNLI